MKFTPGYLNSIKLTATTADQTQAINKSDNAVRIANAGTVVVYVQTFDSSVTAPTMGNKGMAVLPVSSGGAVQIIKKPAEHDSIRYAADSTTAVIYIQTGNMG